MAHLLHANDTSATLFNLLHNPWESEGPRQHVVLRMHVPHFTPLLSQTIGEHVVTHDLDDPVLVVVFVTIVVSRSSEVPLDRWVPSRPQLASRTFLLLAFNSFCLRHVLERLSF